MSCDIRLAEVCSAAINLYSPSSPAFYILLIRSILAPLAITGLVFLSTAVIQTAALHFNIRCLLICMLVSMIISNLGVLLTALYVLFVMFFIPEEGLKCDYLVYNPGTFLRLRQLWSTGGLSLALSALCIAMERILATVRFRNYEKVPLKWIGLLLCTFQVFVGLLPVLGAPAQMCMPYCLDDLVHAENSRIAGDVLFSFNFICLAIFVGLWTVNKKRKVHSGGTNALSKKFQIKENVSTARLMVPVMVIVALMTLSSTIIAHVILPIFDSDKPLTLGIIQSIVTFGNFHEYQTSLMSVLSLLMLFLLPYCSLSIKRSLYRLLHIRLSDLLTDNMPAERANDVHFQNLKGQWERPKRRG